MDHALNWFTSAANTLSIIAAVVAALIALVALGLQRVKIGGFEVQLDRNLPARGMRNVPGDNKAPPPNVPPDATIVQQQYSLLKEYHAQGIAQSKISFWFSLIFAAIGFSVIMFAVGLFLGQDHGPGEAVGAAIQKPTFALVAGTIIEAVSALFFVQSNKARQLMTEFFDRLRVDRKLDEALRLSEAISDEKIKAPLMAVLSLSFSGVQPDGVLNQVLGLTADKGERSPDITRLKHEPKNEPRSELKSSGAAE